MEASNESQTHQIALYLTNGKTLTSLEALRLYGCLRLSARIWDMRRQGMAIKTTIKPTLTGKHIAEYSLIKEANES